MVKTLRKLAALTAVVALVGSFAVCASAVEVSTTTTYGSSAAEILVTSNVTGIVGTDKQVTYYATNGAASETGGIVYIDQKPADNGTATFEFKTKYAYVTSGIKVNYTGSIEAPAEDTITAPTGDAPVEIVASVQDAGGIIAGENSNDGDMGNFAAAAGDRKLTVIGKVTGDVSEFGVIVTTDAIDENATTLPTGRAFRAVEKRSDGIFAVQLIDAEENGTFVEADQAYNVAVYYKVGNAYKIVKYNDTVTVSAQ